MHLKIFLTGDNHIGLKFNSYPEKIRSSLVKARVDNLKNMVDKANSERCDLFAVAGDLFDRVKVAKKDKENAAKILEQFSGTVVVLPGNHDYHDDVVDLWKDFKDFAGENTIVLNTYEPYNLSNNDIDLTLYPAYCNKKHSSDNALKWIKELQIKEPTTWNIGIAHGALNGLSPDIEQKYYNMDEKELDDIGLDLWLLGHTHLPYPSEEKVINRRIFNSGTSEPDGLDCNHGGNAWVITINDSKETSAKRVETGIYRFYDIEHKLESEQCLSKLFQELDMEDTDRKIVRLAPKGRVKREVLEQTQHYQNKFREKFGYLEVRLENLKLQLTKEDIEQQYSKGSFPYQVLNQLLETDNDALHLAYELMEECQNEN
ncbi:metallophosphoesterase [Proteinivorax tanatarense]|uniref:Metallophosphoesterase n=1 Tax=Proteinivorax tanatarense TaxID=1260629 RepID=A0AAU7VJD3_9FIRM